MSLMERLERQKKTNMTGNPASGPGRTTERFSAAAPVTEEYAELKQQVHAEVIDLINRESTGLRDDAPGKKEYIHSGKRQPRHRKDDFYPAIYSSFSKRPFKGR